MTDKPSKNEEEFFAREDAERMRLLRERHAKEQRDAERRSHLMKCPHCGANLTPVVMRGVQIEHCPECEGIWLDRGELELLSHQHHDAGFFSRVVGDLFGSLKRERQKR